MIEVSGLTFQYPKTKAPAVHDVTFTVESGSIFGFLGPSGSGKSTVQGVLTGLLPLGTGHVRYDRVELSALDRSFFTRVGVSFEHPNLFPKLTGKENLTCFAGLYGGARDATKAADELLERVGLKEHKDKKAEDYSKGMKQRLVLARSLLHEPEFLFLDEPTSGLDPATIRDVLGLIREQRDRGASILLTTHDMFVADALSDRMGFLHGGHIVAEGTPRELKLRFGERTVVVESRKDGSLHKETFALDVEEERAALGDALRDEDVETVHSQEATLEDVFVRLTGRGLA